MQWAPTRVFSTVNGTRQQTGWSAEWNCNTCGRIFSSPDPLLNLCQDRPICACGRRRCLSLNFASGENHWFCQACPSPPVRIQGQALCEGHVTTIADATSAPDVAMQATGSTGFFVTGPPAQNHEPTNSFLYCPILLNSLFEADEKSAGGSYLGVSFN